MVFASLIESNAGGVQCSLGTGEHLFRVFERLPMNDRARVDFGNVRGVQYLEPLFVWRRGVEPDGSGSPTPPKPIWLKDSVSRPALSAIPDDSLAMAASRVATSCL